MQLIQITLTSGNIYYTKAEDLREVKGWIDRRDPITIFWYNMLGKRIQEDILVGDEDIRLLMTETDPTPWETE